MSGTLPETQPIKALITGGAGFIGSHLADALLDMGYQVSVIDDLSTGRLDNIGHLLGRPDFHFSKSTVMAEEELAGLVQDADLIYHLAAAVGVKFVVDHPLETLETNTKGTENVLRLAQRFGGKKVILASTSEVYGNSPKLPFKEDDELFIGPPTSMRWGYACSKLVDEFLALAYHKEKGLPVVVLRLFNTIGPRQSGRYGMVVPRFVAQALENQPITVYGDGAQTRCFTYVGDVVEAMAQIAQIPEAEGQVFNIGSDRVLTIRELAVLVKETLASSSPIMCVPYEEAYGPEFDEVRNRVPDISKIQGYLEYQPNTDLAGIIKEIGGSSQDMTARGRHGWDL